MTLNTGRPAKEELAAAIERGLVVPEAAEKEEQVEHEEHVEQEEGLETPGPRPILSPRKMPSSFIFDKLSNF